MHRDQSDFTFFLFVNSKSGGRLGNQFITLQIQRVQFNIFDLKVQLFIYDLINQKSRNQGFANLLISQHKGLKNLRVIICGGDGTILWVIQSMKDKNINIYQIPVGIIPIGTGNDFSRSLGWGGQQKVMIGANLQKLRGLIQGWIEAKVEDFDIWEIEFTVFENGYFKKIVNGASEFIKQSQYKQYGFKRGFTNYCSIGIDGRIGYSFDKYRSESRLINLMIYGAIGFIKSFKPTKNIGQLLEKMEIVDQQEILQQGKIYQPKESKESSSQSKPSEQQRKNSKQFIKKIIFCQKDGPKINKGFQNLVALNINSFMGGVKNIWSTNKIGVDESGIFTEQSSSDGIIEFVGWEGELGLALQRTFTGNAAKIAQGFGPFKLTFQRYQKQDFYTHLQIDGEFYKVGHPKSILYRKSEISPNGVIKVLRKKQRKY